MTAADAVSPHTPTVRVRYWAAARAAAGTDGEEVPTSDPGTVADVVASVLARREGGAAAELARVLGVCSVLIGDRPTKDPQAPVRPGDVLEFLPPFAGG